MYMKRQPLGSILTDWYGSERARSEKMRFLPETRTIAEISETVLRRSLPPGCIEFQLILAAWPQIAGPEIAKRATPFRFEFGILNLEISHPAWLAHFKSKQVKALLVKKINDTLGRDACTDLIFMPAGRLNPDR